MADPGPDDLYESWYQNKLWQLLPAAYRVQDATASGVPGPLQELLNRIGAQTATLRRSIDRLGENQSIETCDDWVIPYIGDLLATRLVSCLDARAQRLDVANTIYYRRRAGTLGLLEELVSDIAGRDARAVEFFRRLGRTRHQWDPPIGNVFAPDVAAWAKDTTYAVGDIVANGPVNTYICVAGGISAPGAGAKGPSGGGDQIKDGGVTWNFYQPLGALVPAVIEGLAGLASRTPAGGFADLRNVYAAANTGTAFDEFAYTADLRAGAQSFGWYNITHLGIFIWWLHTYQIQGATPVAKTPIVPGGPSPCFSFDPSGRKIQLFAAQSRTSASFGDDWVSPDEWELPVAVREVLWRQYPDQLYGPAFSVELGAGGALAPVGHGELLIHPETGQFSFKASPPIGTILTQYCFGLMSTVGAGGFSADLLEAIALPAAKTAIADDLGLDNDLGTITADSWVQIQNSITYLGLTKDLNIGGHTFALTALDGQRPLIRWAAGGATWTIEGKGGSLILQGIWLQGADLVLAGAFQSVTLRFVTLDPGSLDSAGKIDHAIDGMTLAPVRLRVAAAIETLTLDHCITGPVATADKGAIEEISANDCIIQAIDTGGATPDLALHTEIGDVGLARCTVLGPCKIHKMDASECIFDQAAVAEDQQHGCVRFCAIAQGSKLHAPYQSVTIPPLGAVFRSRRFGEADYARLFRLADNAIIDPQIGDTILGGAQNGAEMGAFQSEGVTLLKRGLALKFEEFAPLGVFPVWIEAD